VTLVLFFCNSIGVPTYIYKHICGVQNCSILTYK